VLATHFLNQGCPDETQDLLDYANECIKTTKIDLLRASVDVHQNRMDSAEGLLKGAASCGDPLAHYGLGKIQLIRAEQARKTGDTARFKKYHLEAEGSFKCALNADGERVPKECQILARCSRFVALGGAEGSRDTLAWSDIKTLGIPGAFGSWLAWNTLLASLWKGGPEEVSGVFQEIESLVANVESLDGKAVEGIAAMLARAFLLCDDCAESGGLVGFLERLSSAYPFDTVRRWRDLCVAARTRMRLTITDGAEVDTCGKFYGMEEASRHNAFLALVVGRHLVEAGKLDLAARTLDPGDTSGFLESQVGKCLAELVSGRVPSIDHLPQFSSENHPKIVLGCRLLLAATEFADGSNERAYRHVAESLASNGSNLGGVMNVDRLVVGLCAQMADGSGCLPSVLAILKKLAVSPDHGAHPSVLARCAAAVGESDLACSIWSQVTARDSSAGGTEKPLFAKYLCHLACKAVLSGNSLGASSRLRSAAKLMTTLGK